ncbi:MAG: DNA recombination protein RmuC [Campylobacterales bacterium]
MNISFGNEVIALLIFVFLLIVLVVYLAYKNKTLMLKSAELAKQSELDSFSLNEQIKSSKFQISLLEGQNSELKEEKSRLQDKINTQNREISTLEATLQAEQKNLKALKNEFEEYGNKLELRLDAIMQKGLESKLKKFDDTSIKSLDTLLKPYKESLESFKKKIEESREDSIKSFATLGSQIEMISRAGMNISKEAQNLTEALKGKKQTQGSWGEMILESVLEYSGLIKGTHYKTQESYKDSDGAIKRPDVVVYLSHDRAIIIDAKVSLVDYDAFIKSESDEQRALNAKAVVSAFKKHIDTLAAKDYSAYSSGTLQYVFMFVPIEGAFALAVQEDAGLYEYALKRNIAVVNPSTLTVSLRTIYLFWQHQKANSRVIKLLDEAGKLYDKMDVFVSGFAKIGSQIKSLQGTYEDSYSRLSSGHGNIMGRFENIKKLGARATKDLKKSEVEFDEDGEIELEFEVENQGLIDEK